jgi:hypothetical protein
MPKKTPKIIHFVWAGGEKLMPEQNMERVFEWANHYPNFEIAIWVEAASVRDGMDKIKRHFFDLLEVCPNVRLKDIQADLCDLTISDIGSEYNEYVQYELDRLRPNYGASSDILRYKILYEYGGAYFDSDILPGRRLDELYHFGNVSDTQHQLYFDPNSQNANSVGNDAFITTQYNPAMRALLERSLKNYTPEKIKSCSVKSYEMRYDQYEKIRELTPWLTGPRVVDEVVLKDITERAPKRCVEGRYEENDFDVDNVKVYFVDEHHPQSVQSYIGPIVSTCRTVEGNEAGWANRRVNVAPQEEVFEKIIRSSLFELRHLNLIRLNDHYYNYFQSTGRVFEIDRYFKTLGDRSQNQALQSVLRNGEQLDDIKITIQGLASLTYWENDGRHGSSIAELLEENVGQTELASAVNQQVNGRYHWALNGAFVDDMRAKQTRVNRSSVEARSSASFTAQQIVSDDKVEGSDSSILGRARESGAK